MNRMIRIAPFAILAVFAATLVSGCQATSSLIESPQGVEVSIFQPRSDISKNRIAIKFVNDGKEPLTISATTLTSNLFANDFVWKANRPATVSPGFAIDLRVDIPPVDSCDEGRSSRAVRFDWTVGQVSGTSFITPDDTFNILANLHDNGCFISAMNTVGAISAVSLTPSFQKLTPATLLISIAPTGQEGTLTINSIGSTTLLSPADSKGIVTAQLDFDLVISAKGPFKINVPIVPNRCDAHGIAEDKIGTRMPLVVTLADGTKGRYVLPASNQLRAAMYSFYTSYCGLG